MRWPAEPPAVPSVLPTTATGDRIIPANVGANPAKESTAATDRTGIQASKLRIFILRCPLRKNNSSSVIAIISPLVITKLLQLPRERRFSADYRSGGTLFDRPDAAVHLRGRSRAARGGSASLTPVQYCVTDQRHAIVAEIHVIATDEHGGGAEPAPVDQ